MERPARLSTVNFLDDAPLISVYNESPIDLV